MAAKVVNLKEKKRSFLGRKEIIVIIIAVVLTTAGIKASDTILSGDVSSNDGDGPCPEGMVLIPFAKGDFCMDKYENSAGENCSHRDPGNQTNTRINLDDPDCYPESVAGASPWRNISLDQAKFACAKAGKRLPSNEEWLQASQGTIDKTEGWGSNDCQVDNNWDQQPGLTGTGANCVSSFGAFDMIGNVWEWVDGVVEEGVYDDKTLPDQGFIHSTGGNSLPLETNPSEPNPNYNNDYFWIKNKGIRGMVRGGYWGNEADAGIYSLYVVTPPSQVEPGIGFRCVK